LVLDSLAVRIRISQAVEFPVVPLFRRLAVGSGKDFEDSSAKGAESNVLEIERDPGNSGSGPRFGRARAFGRAGRSFVEGSQGKADLFDNLRDDGPFTVFAPTDEAFSKIPADDLASLLKPENREALKKLLLLHVVPGKLTAEALASHGSPKSLSGVKLMVAANRRGLAVNEATVVKADIPCRNGIIHAIDRVLTPSASPTDILSVAGSKKSFKILIEAVKAAGLEDTLRGDGPFTILAPTDEAFGKLSKEKLEALLQPSNRGKLAEILKFHVIPGRLTATQVVSAGKAKTLQGGSVAVSIDEGRLVIGGAKVIATDIMADNGIIHVIDSVLIPE
jgi:uncharacterized surface protein with fasciclin (FAS1) repeats